MTQEEQILHEINEFKVGIRQSYETIRNLEKRIKEKETELYYAKLESIVKNWLPPELSGNGVYEDGWNDYRDECLNNLK